MHFDIAQGSHQAVELVRKQTRKVGQKKKIVSIATRNLIVLRLNGKEFIEFIENLQ